MPRFGNEILGKTVSLRPIRKIARDRKISIDMQNMNLRINYQKQSLV